MYISRHFVSSFALILGLFCFISCGSVRQFDVAEAWAGNTVNTAVFRKNSLVSDDQYQYISFYDASGFLTIGRRKLGTSDWIIERSEYRGNVRDAHNVISMMVDGDGYLHVVFDHHDSRLRYVKSLDPQGIVLGDEQLMVGTLEEKVTYPEFFRMPAGDVLFLYRDGGSGAGNLVINSYDLSTKKWIRLHDGLIDGERQRNAYWQVFVDRLGTIHLSWVWRESPDVASNHDMAYACSKDGGKTWQNSQGKAYSLPITASSAEYAAKIPMRSELINQTAISADEIGRPYIATYWRESGDSVPQYRIIYRKNDSWEVKTLPFRTTAFSLSGGGTKEIPIARPQILVRGKGEQASCLLVFRDIERGSRASLAVVKMNGNQDYKLYDLNKESLGNWEPSYDSELWRRQQVLHLFTQYTPQADGEGVLATEPTMVRVLEWRP